MRSASKTSMQATLPLHQPAMNSQKTMRKSPAPPATGAPPARFTPIWLRATFYSVKPKLIQQSRTSAAPGRRTSWRKVGSVRHVLLTRHSRSPKPKPSANGCGVTPSRCASPNCVPALACVATPPNPFRWEPGNADRRTAPALRPTIRQMVRNDWPTSCAS